MVFVSVYKKKIKKTQKANETNHEVEQDFIVLLYHHAVTLTRFGIKRVIQEKEINCCEEEEAIVLNPFMMVWWFDNGSNEMTYGLHSLIPEEDQLFVEHLTPRWMLDPKISSIMAMLNVNSAKQFSSKMHMGLLSLGLTFRGFQKRKEEAECKIDYDRVMAARKQFKVIQEEQELHETIKRVIRKYEIPRQFHFWSSAINPPQIRDIELH